MIYLKDYISTERMKFVNTNDKNEIIEDLINLSPKKLVRNLDVFKKAVFERENILSTAIGNNVAIPHVRMKEIDDFFINIAIHKNGLEWDSLDGLPVHIIFLIGGPDNHKKYLQILSKLTLIIKNRSIRDDILKYKEKDEIVKIFNNL